MIFECLYEDYELRPDVLELKNRIQECSKVAISANPRGDEPWEDFVHPGPEEDDWDPDAWDPNAVNPDEVKRLSEEAGVPKTEIADEEQEESDETE
jgi:hypothetical protein